MIYSIGDTPTAWAIVQRSATVQPTLLAFELLRHATTLRATAWALEPSRATVDSPTACMVELASRLESAAAWLQDGEPDELRAYCEEVHGYKAPKPALCRALVAIAGRLTCVPAHVQEAALGEVR